MILKLITDIDVFAEKAEPVIGVWASKKWLSIYGNQLHMVGVYKDDKQLIGGFFYLKTKKMGLDFIKLPPYTPHCGLFFINESKNQASRNSFAKDVVNEVCTYFNSLKSALTVLAFPTAVTDMQPFIWHKYKVIPNYTYRIGLQNSLEEIKSHFDSKNRNVINKALKEGVDVQCNTLSKEQLFGFFNANLSATGANIYPEVLRKIVFNFSDDSNTFHFSAYKEGQLLGTVMCVYDKQTCYYLLGSVNKQSGIAGVNNLLVQYSIEKAKDLGCMVFDFEGSMLKGVEKFFRSFGPQMYPYYTANKAKLPLEIILKFKKRELF